MLAACQNMPEPYAPPVQRQPFENPRPYRISRVVSMADGDADAHIVQDIPKAQGGTWRWTGQKPTLHVAIRTNEKLKFTIDYSVPDVTLKDTGPVTIVFFVNGHEVDRQRQATAGEFHFEKPVPAEWINAGQENTVSAEIDKVWIAPRDGAKLGFILTRMGLTQ